MTTSPDRFGPPLKRLADGERFSDEEIDHLLAQRHAPSWMLKAVIAQIRTEKTDLREALEFCLPWAEVAIDQMDSTPLATSRLKKVREFKELLRLSE